MSALCCGQLVGRLLLDKLLLQPLFGLLLVKPGFHKIPDAANSHARHCRLTTETGLARESDNLLRRNTDINREQSDSSTPDTQSSTLDPSTEANFRFVEQAVYCRRL